MVSISREHALSTDFMKYEGFQQIFILKIILRKDIIILIILDLNIIWI